MGETHGSPTYPTVQKVTGPDSGLPEQHTGYGVGQGAQGRTHILKKWHLPLHSTQQNNPLLSGLKAAYSCRSDLGWKALKQ